MNWKAPRLVALAAVVIAASLALMAAVALLQYREIAAGASGAIEAGQRFEATHVVAEVSPKEAMPSRDAGGPPIGSPAPDVVIEGQGTTPAPVDLRPGLWVAEIRFIEYTPPTVGEIPGVSINSRSGNGGMAWSGREWAPLFVGDWRHPGRVASFLSGDVLGQVTAIPEDVRWVLRFVPLGDLRRP